MKTPEGIKKGLETCIGKCIGNKPHCPYHSCGDGCMDTMNRDALAYIQQLESELEAVKRERDAAVKDLTEGRRCHSCKHIGRKFEGPCGECMSGHGYERNHYEWRGVCPENTEVQDGQV